MEVSSEPEDITQLIYQGAEALKIPTKKRENWVSYLLHLIEEGPVITLIEKLRQHGVERLDRLANHLERFRQ